MLEGPYIIDSKLIMFYRDQLLINKIAIEGPLEPCRSGLFDESLLEAFILDLIFLKVWIFTFCFTQLLK